MKSGGFVSQDRLNGGDNRKGIRPNSPPNRNASINASISGGGSDFSGDNSDGLRLTVARRFMRMMRAHDRIRMQLLTEHQNVNRRMMRMRRI